MNGEVASGGLKKLGHTRPPILSSSDAALSSPISLDRTKRNTPFHTGHTGRRANFSVLAIFRRLLDVEGGEVVVVLVVADVPASDVLVSDADDRSTTPPVAADGNDDLLISG